MDFPMVHDTATLNEQPFLLPFGSRTNFWVAEEVGEAGQIFFWLFKIFLPSAFQWYMTQLQTFNEHLFLVIFGAGTNFCMTQEVGGAGQNTFRLKALS